MLAPKSLPNSHDDTVLTISYKSLETLEMNTITRYKQYSSNYNLVLNKNKTVLMFFNTKNKNVQLKLYPTWNLKKYSNN